MKRVEQIHAILAVTEPGDITLDTDSQFASQGRRVMDVVDEPIEGIPAVLGTSGLLVPMVRAHTTPNDLEDLIRLGRLATLGPGRPDRLEVVRFTMRHHVAWIER